MKLSDEQIIEEIYKTGIFADIETGSTYKKLLHKYNVLFDSIEDSKLKSKFEKLEQLKNDMFGESNKDIFKLGFSIATKILVESLDLNNNDERKK